MTILNWDISIVLYDITTLYFEISDEDDLSKNCFSKDVWHKILQIFIDVVVVLRGYAFENDFKL
jgi:hypothetical protein